MRIKAAQHDFAKAPQANIQRSKYDRSFNLKTTFDNGYLIPFLVDEILPGDTYHGKLNAFARFATLLFPLFDNMYIDVFYFFVPNRLVWDNWEKFNGYQVNPNDPTDIYSVPRMTSPAGGYAYQSIYDYLGLKPGVAGFTHNVLPLRGLNLIYNDWFRDENFNGSLVVRKTDSGDVPADFALFRRGKRKDYFTGCLPWPQKGTAVTIPLGTTAPIVSNGLAPAFNPTTGGVSGNMVVNAGTNPNIQWNNTSGGTNLLRFTPNGETGLLADLSMASSATINAIRQAFQIQRMYERDARGGTRYNELIYSHFQVSAPDFRLQRPEYLGGGRSHVNITPVVQTSPTGTYANTPQGNLAAIGTASILDNGFSKSFVEHGFVFGLLSLRADLTYQDGLNRMWSRVTRFDYFWPTLAHLGEQAVLNKEIYVQGTAADDQTFGYNERYAEYRYYPSQITGLFRSDAPGTLDSWHLAQDFSTLPVLGATFINESVPTSRVKAVTTEPDIILDGRMDLHCARPIPLYGVPGLIDHF